MTVSEKLRAEMAASFPIERSEFIDMLADGIRRNGCRGFLCDRHIQRTHESAIAMRDEQAAIKIAESEGFRYHYERNSYGVRRIVFTL